jgi:tRNA/rRNA methyltransferase
MAGTDSSRSVAAPRKATGKPEPLKPIIILVEPQLGENIGACARAMLNCGLTAMRIVRPREAWPNEKARRSSSGADIVLENARLFDTTAEAVADLQHVFATTARPRGMAKAVISAREATAMVREFNGEGRSCGILFGPERTGLENDDVALAEWAVQVPLNPEFSSLNLGQAVLILAYEWYQLGGPEVDAGGGRRRSPPANRKEMLALFAHLEHELDRAGFFYPPDKRPRMLRNIRTMFLRAHMTEQEVRTLRGAIKALVEPRARGDLAERPLGRKPRTK